jgi:hypothetical protein
MRRGTGYRRGRAGRPLGRPGAAFLRRGACSACLALLACLAASAPAGADVFEPISLVSASPFQQFEYAHDPAISGDGRYVVFDGSVAGVTGVWRRENRPGGELVQVAGGDAELPSISQNGRYVSFTTNEGGALPSLTDELPDPAPREETPNVYVRDMSKAPAAPGAFTLASALSYEYPAGGNRSLEERDFGSVAAGRTALSADGQKVVFVTTAASNLDGPKTPPLEVGVHDLETGSTEIVSVRADPATGAPLIDPETGRVEPVPLTVQGTTEIGAVYTRGGPQRFELPQPHQLPSGPGASISADGSTVAWMGQEVGDQAEVLPSEDVDALTAPGSEPLWRRIADGPTAPTRRVTGGSDPANPQCAAHPEESLPRPASPSDPCQGPFATSPSIGTWSKTGVGYVVPQLSADGYTVAFLATAPLVSQGGDFGAGPEGISDDVYVADMHEGLTRNQALDQLTEIAGGDATRIATDGRILDLGISPEGGQVAFTTQRTAFPLGLPSFVSAPAAVPGLAELFDVDLDDGTLTRVTIGYEGDAAEHPHEEFTAPEDLYGPLDGALSPSFTDGGETLAFSSTASNLVYGDGNTPPARSSSPNGSDVFVVNRILFGSTPTQQYISGVPSPPSVTPAWSLGTTALSLGDGNVLLYVDTPGEGTLSALASSPVRTLTRASHLARRARRKGLRAHAAATVSTRTVADATGRIVASEGGLTTLLLKLHSSYRSLAARRGGLSATANLTFTAPGHPALRQSIAVTFARVASKKPVARPRAATRARSKAGGSVR